MFFAFLGGAPHVVVTMMGHSSAVYGVWFAVTSIGYMAGNFFAARSSVHIGLEVLEMVWKVGVERHGVSGVEVVRGSRAYESQAAVGDERGLAAPRLVHRRVRGTGGRGARRERMARHLGALPGQRRRHYLVAVPAPRRAPGAPLGAPDDRHAVALVDPQQLR